MTNRIAKRSEMCDSGVLVEAIWGILDPVVLKVILVSSITLPIFPEWRFLKCYSYRFNSFSTKLFLNVLCDGPYNSYVVVY